MDLLVSYIHFPITDPTWIFFLVLTIILFAPLVLKRLRIPHIIGMILAGVVIGGHGFNILDKDSSFELFGKVGLYYIMFLAGLEMDMEDFKMNKLKTLVFGLLTFSIPMILGVASSSYLLGFPLITAILLASMYASHTLISYPIVSRYGLSRMRSVSITVGGTVITDTLALLILAVIASMFKENVDEYFWYTMTAKVCGVLAFIVLIMPRLARYFFRHYDDNIMQFVFVLSLVFLGAGLLEMAGLEGILGAFIVGLVLNRLIPRLSPLMNRLEFVGNALFIPYFLIGVGMIIDVRTLFKGGEALKVALVMTVVATSAKWLAALVTQKIYKFKKEERSIIFGLSNAQAAATLAAVLVGNKIEVSPGVPLLNDNVLNGTVVMILITCMISSIVTERAARKMVAINQKQEDDDSITDAKPKEQENILIPVANPNTIEDLVNMAILMKDVTKPDGLIGLHVINDSSSTDRSLTMGQKCLDTAVSVAAAADVSMAQVMRYDINIASGIIHTIKEQNVSEVVIGLHKKANIVDSYLGQKAINLLNGTNKQILIVKTIMPINTIRKILVVVPAKAELESGFAKWMNRLARIASQMGCRIQFFSTDHTLGYIKGYVDKNFKALRVSYEVMEAWSDLLLLTKLVNFDHLLIIVTARKGSVSYNSEFQELPHLLSKYFLENSLAILYPDQFGETEEVITFANPIRSDRSASTQGLMTWFTNKFKKS